MSAAKIWMLAVGLFFLSAVSAVQASQTKVFGGTGGAPFRSQCVGEDVMIGINFRAGAGIDAVSALCMSMNAEKNAWTGQAYNPTDMFGGAGGGRGGAICNNGDLVIGIGLYAFEVNGNMVITGIRLTCFHDASHDRYDLVAHNPEEVAGDKRFDCNAPVTGLRGRSGDMVDALGLICMDLN